MAENPSPSPRDGAPPASTGPEAEIEALRQRVEQLENRAGKRRHRRRVVAALLVVIVSITFTASTVAVWARRNFLNNTVFSERVAPLILEPEVKAALSRKLGDEVVQLIDPKALFDSVLPERGHILAVPLANAVDGFIRSEVDKFVNSQEFAKLWVALTSRAHKAAVNVLRGETTQLGSSANGDVTLNLVPVIDDVLAIIGQQSPEIFGRKVDIPTITVDDVPAVALQKLETALGVNLSDGYGTITVFESDQLAEVQDAVALFDKLTILLVIVTLLLLPLTLWVSPSRRRTLLQLLVGVAVGMVLIRRFSYLIENDVLDLVKIDANRPAVDDVVSVFLDPLRRACGWILGGLGAIGLIALLTGPYRWAVWLRAGVAQGGRAVGDVAVQGARGARDPRARAWLIAHRDQLRIGEVAVAILALLVLDLSWLGLLLLAAAIGALELFFARTRSGQPPDEEDSAPPAAGDGPPAATATSAPS